MGRLIDEDIVIDIINFECGKWTGLSKTIEKEIKALPSSQQEWGKPVGDGRPLADSEIIPRLQDIKAQIGGSYAIDRAIEVLEGLQDAQPKSYKEKLKEIADALSEKFAYMNTCLNERDIILGYLGVKRPSEIHCNTDCTNIKCESHYCYKKTPSTQPEIIRCKDCKHYYYADNRIPQEQRYSCDLDGDRWKPEDFCSYAERRGEQDE